jgi:hypothetical protein
MQPARTLDANLIAIGDGGARRVRTDDLMLAKHALYQLSYGPFSRERSGEPSVYSIRGYPGIGRPGQI